MSHNCVSSEVSKLRIFRWPKNAYLQMVQKCASSDESQTHILRWLKNAYLQMAKKVFYVSKAGSNSRIFRCHTKSKVKSADNINIYKKVIHNYSNYRYKKRNNIEDTESTNVSWIINRTLENTGYRRTRRRPGKLNTWKRWCAWSMWSITRARC